MADLSGIHLLVTRPQPQADSWAGQLKALGARVTCHPFLAIQPLHDAESERAITNKLLQLDLYQKAIFVSQNAVTYGADWIDRFWPQLPTEPDFFAVGSSTAQLLEEKLTGFGAVVTAPQQAMNSEALLALPGLMTVTGDKILIFRGRGGRTHLGQTLTARGAQVDYCELYQRLIPDVIDTGILDDYRHTHLTAVTVVHSGETLKNLCSAIANVQQEALMWFRQQPLLVPGERVARLAAELDFAQVIVALNATNESMIGALNDWRQQ